MFYLSSINGSKHGITDTVDDIEELYTGREIAKFVERDKITIYGVVIYNHTVDNATILVPNISIEKAELIKRIDNWRKVHNKWTGLPVSDYLACAKIGTIITVDYISYTDEGHYPIKGTTVIIKKEEDTWIFNDINNTFNGKEGNSEFAAWALEVSCIYSKPKNLVIQQGGSN